MHQRPFEWHQRRDDVPMVEVVLDPKTLTSVITRMATALIAVVRGASPSRRPAMTSDSKITPDHLRRRAVVYLRQSSEGQVRHNVESQHLQYALADRARGLGFHDVDILDVDLGASAAVAAKRRAGFERLLGAVALGEVGLILSRETIGSIRRVRLTDSPIMGLTLATRRGAIPPLDTASIRHATALTMSPIQAPGRAIRR